jgi:hypothetical protein
MPSTTNLQGEEIVNAPEQDGNASMPEQVKRANPWRMMTIMMMKFVVIIYAVMDCNLRECGLQNSVRV